MAEHSHVRHLGTVPTEARLPLHGNAVPREKHKTQDHNSS